MSKEYQKILLFFLILFSVYCALIIGLTWDEGYHSKQGKIIIDYLFSLGEIDKEYFYRENYSAIYWSLSYLITKQFPYEYQIEISHLINLIFSLSTIIGIGKLGKELFNRKLGKILFLILFFYPIFFGHMAINNKDTILAFSHVWITYLLFRYLKKQNINKKKDKYIICMAILAALATGIQLVFFGSLMPIILLIIFDIFVFKKFININFSIKKFFYDLIKCFIIFYILLIIFWIDTHSNIFTLPFSILFNTFSESYWTGWPFNLINGHYYLSSEVPKNYLFLNLLYKSPEYILICYCIFLILIFKKFYRKKFIFFNYKITFVIFIILYPNFVLLLVPYPIYDGVRLFIWMLPYVCIIPALVIYYLVENFNNSYSKIMSFFIFSLCVYFLFNFFLITPYQYTYLNLFTGKSENRYKKFENDYWGASIKELIKKTKFKNNKTISISTCGVSPDIVDYYLKKKGYSNFEILSPSDADYIVMTNRVVHEERVDNNYELFNCFERYPGDNLFYVMRNGLLLSTIRKK